MTAIQDAWEDIRANGTAMMMVVRCGEMPSIYQAAVLGNEDAQIRLAAVGGILGPIDRGEHACIFCNTTTTTSDLAAVVFVSKEIEHGAAALFTLVCNACDEPDHEALTQKIMKAIGVARQLYQAGHA